MDGVSLAVFGTGTVFVLIALFAVIGMYRQLIRAFEAYTKSSVTLATEGYVALLSRTSKEYADAVVQKEVAMKQLEVFEKQLLKDVEDQVKRAPAAQIVHTEDGQEISLDDPRYEF